MKVLLCEDIEKLGFYGDVVSVKTGYARNYLLPQGLAVVPSEAAVKSMAMERAKRAEERKLVREQLEGAAAKVEGAEVAVSAKANDLGHLFGSVAEKDIAENLREQGFEVKNDMIRMSNGHIKEVGEHHVEVRFAADLFQSVKVTVVAQAEEGQDEPAEEQSNEE